MIADIDLLRTGSDVETASVAIVASFCMCEGFGLDVRVEVVIEVTQVLSLRI